MSISRRHFPWFTKRLRPSDTRLKNWRETDWQSRWRRKMSVWSNLVVFPGVAQWSWERTCEILLPKLEECCIYCLYQTINRSVNYQSRNRIRGRKNITKLGSIVLKPLLSFSQTPPSPPFSTLSVFPLPSLRELLRISYFWACCPFHTGLSVEIFASCTRR